jgi:hypothetical protein
MMPIGEAGKTARSFFDALKDEPLSLALCVMNIILLGYLFYEGSAVTTQRKETVDAMIQSQGKSNQLLANCVSKDVLDTVVHALERDRDFVRSLLPPQSPAVIPSKPPGTPP